MLKIDSEFSKEKNRSISKVMLKFPNLFKNILQNNILLTKLKENFVTAFDLTYFSCMRLARIRIFSDALGNIIS